MDAFLALLHEPHEDGAFYRDRNIQREVGKAVVSAQAVIRLVNRELIRNGLSRLSWIGLILGTNLQGEGLSRSIVKEGCEVHPETFKRVRLLNVVPHHDLSSLAFQGIRLFRSAVVVRIVISERLDMHQAVVVWDARLVGAIRSAHLVFPQTHMKDCKGVAHRRVEEVGENLQVFDIVGLEQALYTGIDNGSSYRGIVVHVAALDVHPLHRETHIFLAVRIGAKTSVQRGDGIGDVETW